MAEPFSFRREGRTSGLQFALIAIYGVLTVLVYAYDAAFWIIALLILPTLPALYDLYTNPVSTLTMSEERIDWRTGKRSGHVMLTNISHLRFDTRWDFSVRVTVELSDGKHLRLPQPCIPPHRNFETVCESFGLRVDRHHFRVF